jgi:hypothetical protein
VPLFLEGAGTGRKLSFVATTGRGRVVTVAWPSGGGRQRVGVS